MVQGYYTLQEASKLLAMPVDELKQMAQKGKIRSFQDRGTLRFRIQDIQELARVRGGTSDPELVLGDATAPPPPPKSAASASKKSQPSPKTPAKQQAAPDVFDFDFGGDNVDLGADLPGPSSGSKSKPGSKSKKAAAPAGGDSDVRLVSDGSDVTFSIPKDSDIKLANSDVKISPDPLKPKTSLNQPTPSSGSKRPSQLALGSAAQPKSKLGGASSASRPASPHPVPTPQPVDSGVRLVPMDSDSDVKLLGSDDVPLGQSADPAATDSNVRLDKIGLPSADSGEGAMNLTEEINLDEEILKHQERVKDQPATKVKPKSELKLPSASPFELSDSDLELPAELRGGAVPKTPRKSKAGDDDSSDFDLAAQSPTADGSILLEGSDSGDFSLEASDGDEQVLHQDGASELTSSTSGISLNNPVDQGISLEGNEDAGDFDLSLEVEDTPKPAKSSPVDDSDSGFELTAQKAPKPKKAKPQADSSEFELSLDSDADAPLMKAPGESSEFELNLEDSGEGDAGTSESDSEFELTLDDSGHLAAVDDEPAPQVKAKAKAKKPASADEQDIFDTDFEVPALEESDDAAVTDSELESSDFDLALDDSELAQEDESGSQVVALDEDDAETVVDADGDAVVDDVDVEEESSDFQDLDQDVEVEEDGVDVDAETDEETQTVGQGRRETVIREKLIPAAPWGMLPVIFMLPCVVVMFLVGILGYELMKTTAGMQPPGPLTRALAEQFGTPIK
jgi:hypothetical protein